MSIMQMVMGVQVTTQTRETPQEINHKLEDTTLQHSFIGPEPDDDGKIYCIYGCGCWVRRVGKLSIETGGPVGCDPGPECPNRTR